jgi:hypothetical protein
LAEFIDKSAILGYGVRPGGVHLSKPIPLSAGDVIQTIPEGIENDEAPSVRWDRTSRMEDRIGWQLTQINHPTRGMMDAYKGRHIISRDKPIVEGVYLGVFEREAIVVSEVTALIDCYYRLLQKIRTDMTEEQTVRAVHAHVRATLPKGRDVVDELIRSRGVLADRKICLSMFMHAQAGVCRHRALLAAYLLERLGTEGVLSGHVSIDRNETDEGGHAWARFVSSKHAGCVWIVDAGLDVCGQLFHLEESRWSYARPEDVAIPRVVETSPLPPAPVQSADPQSPMTFTEFAVATLVISTLAASYLWNYG